MLRLAPVLALLVAAVLAVASMGVQTGALPAGSGVPGGMPGNDGDDLGQGDGPDEDEGETGVSVGETPMGVELVGVTDAQEGETSRMAGDLVTCAQELVGRYAGRGDCLVRQAGYLDLAGDVWGCVMEGPGWVDVCVLWEDADERHSWVRTTRWEVSAWTDLQGV